MENIEKEPISKIAKAISMALTKKGGEVILPNYNPEILPPKCEEKDLKDIVAAIQKFNDGPVDENELYVSAQTSQDYIDFAEQNPRFRTNQATMLRIVCNATLDEGEIAGFNPGFKRDVQLQLDQNAPNIQIYEKGKIIPLSLNGNYFGVAAITDQKYNKHSRPQFGLIFDIIVDQKIKNVDALLFDLLKSSVK